MLQGLCWYAEEVSESRWQGKYPSLVHRLPDSSFFHVYTLMFLSTLSNTSCMTARNCCTYVHKKVFLWECFHALPGCVTHVHCCVVYHGYHLTFSALFSLDFAQLQRQVFPFVLCWRWHTLRASMVLDGTGYGNLSVPKNFPSLDAFFSWVNLLLQVFLPLKYVWHYYCNIYTWSNI